MQWSSYLPMVKGRKGRPRRFSPSRLLEAHEYCSLGASGRQVVRFVEMIAVYTCWRGWSSRLSLLSAMCFYVIELNWRRILLFFPEDNFRSQSLSFEESVEIAESHRQKISQSPV